MKKSILSVFTLLTLNVAVAQQFEGIISMNTTNQGLKEEASITWYLKGTDSRMDVRSTADGHTSQYAIIIDGKGTDMVSQGHVTPIPSNSMRGAGGQTLLSRKEGVSVNGYSCTQAVYFDGQNQTTFWFTEELPITSADLPNMLRTNLPSDMEKGFPIKMEKRNPKGDILLSQEVTSVQAATVEVSKFERK